MAVDEILSRSVEAGGLPFLRFYEWKPGSLSLGRFQHPEWGLTPESQSVPRVRRMTGGGAIWHETELTYSLGCRTEHLPVTGVKASFELLSGFLLDTWKSWDWPAAWAKDTAIDPKSLGVPTAACFAGHEAYDILVGGKKLGGNAQSRSRTTIFQHGSIPIRLDFETLKTLFLKDFLPPRQQVTSLSEQGWTGSSAELIRVLQAAFVQRTSAQWKPSELSPDEQAEAEILVTEKHSSSFWLEKGNGSVRVQGPAMPTTH